VVVNCQEKAGGIGVDVSPDDRSAQIEVPCATQEEVGGWRPGVERPWLRVDCSQGGTGTATLYWVSETHDVALASNDVDCHGMTFFWTVFF
jgi:hypothetical protein